MPPKPDVSPVKTAFLHVATQRLKVKCEGERSLGFFDRIVAELNQFNHDERASNCRSADVGSGRNKPLVNRARYVGQNVVWICFTIGPGSCFKINSWNNINRCSVSKQLKCHIGRSGRVTGNLTNPTKPHSDWIQSYIPIKFQQSLNNT